MILRALLRGRAHPTVNDRESCIVRGYRLEALPRGGVPSYTVEEFPAGRAGQAAGLDALEECLVTPRAAYTHFVLWKILETPVASSPVLDELNGEVLAD